MRQCLLQYTICGCLCPCKPHQCGELAIDGSMPMSLMLVRHPVTTRSISQSFILHFCSGAAVPGAGLNLQQRIAQYHQDQRGAPVSADSPRAAGQQPAQLGQRGQQAPATPQQGLHSRSISLPPALLPHRITWCVYCMHRPVLYWRVS